MGLTYVMLLVWIRCSLSCVLPLSRCPASKGTLAEGLLGGLPSLSGTLLAVRWREEPRLSPEFPGQLTPEVVQGVGLGSVV